MKIAKKIAISVSVFVMMLIASIASVICLNQINAPTSKSSLGGGALIK